MIRAPLSPKRLIRAAAMEKCRQFVYVTGSNIPSQKVSQGMQRRVPNGIGRMQRAETQAFQFPDHAALPELMESLWLQAFRYRIPELVMQLKSCRDLRIEEVALPFPTVLTDQRRQV